MGGRSTRSAQYLARLMSAPEIAATFGVGGLPVGERAHIISRTVKLFGQGEGDGGNPYSTTKPHDENCQTSWTIGVRIPAGTKISFSSPPRPERL